MRPVFIVARIGNRRTNAPRKQMNGWRVLRQKPQKAEKAIKAVKGRIAALNIYASPSGGRYQTSDRGPAVNVDAIGRVKWLRTL